MERHAVTGADVLVVGAGPAGWAAAAACACRGLRVHLVAPEPRAVWRQTYGAWRDELAAAGVADLARAVWDRVLVRTVGPDLRSLARTYCLLDNDAVLARLMSDAASATVTAARVTGLESRGDHLMAATTDGRQLHAAAVIDATGHPAVFGRRPGRRPAYQTAYGIDAVFDRPPLPPGTMCLMDLEASAFDDGGPPTFLYGMDLGDGRWFVEETSLAARPGVPLATLQRRLERRLAERRTPPSRVLDVERCAFAMDAPLPPPGPAIAFGAAAAMVHPATGYHVATALTRAPDLAAAIHEAMAVGDDPARIARAGHHAVWTADDLRRDALYRLGLDVLLGLDTPSIQAFFEAFFALPPDDWRGYVSRTSSPLRVHLTMLRLMRTVPPTVRRRVLRETLRPGAGRMLARSLVPARLT